MLKSIRSWHGGQLIVISLALLLIGGLSVASVALLVEADWGMIHEHEPRVDEWHLATVDCAEDPEEIQLSLTGDIRFISQDGKRNLHTTSSG